MPTLELADFRKGVNNNQKPWKLKQNEAIQAQNCVIENGDIEPMNASGLVASTGNTNKSLYKFNGTWYTSDNTRYFVEFNQRLYWVDDTNVAQKTDGTNTYALGGAAPAAAPSILAYAFFQAGDTPPGPYTNDRWDYVQTYYSTAWGIETAPSPVSNDSANTFGNGWTDQWIISATLNAAIGSADSSFVITQPTNSVITSRFVQLGTEIIEVTWGAMSGAGPYTTTATVVARGSSGTNAQPWGKGTPVRFLMKYVQVGFGGSPPNSSYDTAKLYRLNGSAYELVTSRGSSVNTAYNDVVADKNLGAAIPTRSGQTLGYYPPPSTVKGCCGPYNGMMIYWDDYRVYWSEVNLPDCVPTQNQTPPYRTKIARCIIYGSEIVVLTAEGVFTLSGGDASSMNPGREYSQHGCLQANGRTAAVVDNVGIYQQGAIIYLSIDGLAVFNGITTTILDQERINQVSLAALTGTFAEAYQGRYYLFYSGGCWIVDFRFMQEEGPIWRSYTETPNGIHKNFVDGNLYLGFQGAVNQMGTGSPMTWTYQTGSLLCDQGLVGAKYLCRIQPDYVGPVTFTLAVDGTTWWSHTLGETTRPRWPQSYPVTEFAAGREPQLTMSGTGKVYGVFIEYEEGVAS